jgi:hypothetical protein
MKNITLTCEWKPKEGKENNPALPENPDKKKEEFWGHINIKSSEIEKNEKNILESFPKKLHEKVREKILNIGVCKDKSGKEWERLILQKTTSQKLQWWNEITLKVAQNEQVSPFKYESISFIVEFVADRYLPDIFEYSIRGFELLVYSCLQETFFESIGQPNSGSDYQSIWTISPNAELIAAFYSPPSQSEPSSDSPSTSHSSPQLPPPPSTPANGTNLSSSGSGAIQIINDFSSGLPGNSNAVMRSSGVTEKVMTAAAAAPENMTPVARTAARTLNGIDPLKALALVVTIISIVVSSLVVMEYNAEKHRYQDMEKALLDKYESLLSQYGKLLEAQGKPE